MSVVPRRSAALPRRRVLLLPLAIAAAVPVMASTAALAGPHAGVADADAAASAATRHDRRTAPATVDGLVFRRLPHGLGARWDSSPYHYDEVDFAAAVWESGSDALGWQVDLDITVMRGERLRSPRALHDWFIEYQERPADEVHYRPTTVHGARGWVTRDQIFWLVRPGLGVSVTLDAARWSRADLRRLVDSATTGEASRVRASG